MNHNGDGLSMNKMKGKKARTNLRRFFAAGHLSKDSIKRAVKAKHRTPKAPKRSVTVQQ
ncbi:MAG: hypothetical protein ACPGTU_02955 [Myxococcota bacterium]